MSDIVASSVDAPDSTPSASILSAASRPIIEATLPVVGEHLGDISRIFYRQLFDNLPSLESDLFNRTNQANGEQQKALAGAVAAFATLLVTEDAPPVDEVMSRIAAKHASLGILQVHYDLVHTALFAAIVDVLGDAVTPEVAAAWDEVYWLMANSLMAQEAVLYEAAGVSAGHVWQPMTVLGKREVAPGVWTFTFGDTQPGAMMNCVPGQYVSVSVVFPDDTRQIRQYTVVWGEWQDTWEITVEAVRGGLVSNRLIDDVGVGDPLVVSIPVGDPYPIREGNPVVLGSSGIGSAVSVGLLQRLVSHGDIRPVRVIHVDRRPELFAHGDKLDELLSVYRGPSSFHTEYADDIEHAVSRLRDGKWDRAADVYLCGSPNFMRKMRRVAVREGVAPTNIHYEVFAPDSWLGFD
ncbi:globin domain-containing protein [Rhodococcus gannanensis]|uniref:nitric oxide dioxygenase n=1 Tax=Rhodococcus gannanensis TaxID=1960308 RepID=A0ABW4P610_9NOCA